MKRAALDLAARDPVMARMLRQHGVPNLRSGRPRRPHFASLARMICYQQLAGRAAATIHGRFEALFEGRPDPVSVLAIAPEKLRGAGLSANKAASIVDLAHKVSSGVVQLHRAGRLSDEEVVRELILVRGIGEWTAHMFLMFQLGRTDVWPTLDYGVRNGYAQLYELPSMPTPRELEPLGDRFKPHRSLVAWYCWRVVDTRTPAKP